MASIADTPFTFIGLDVHKDSISAGILEPGVDDPTHDKIFHDEASIRRLLGRFDAATLKVFYEAGPTGYGLARLLASMGIDCQVVAPSLIPTAPGDRVKTDKRDCRRLVRLARAGELTPMRIPSELEEAVRDLCRVRVDAVQERRRARQRLGGFLLRHGRMYRDGGNWTLKHEQWLNSLTFDEPATTATFGHCDEVLHDNLSQAWVTENDIRSKLRAANVLNYGHIRAVVFDQTGDISVLHGDADLDPALLSDVIGVEHLRA